MVASSPTIRLLLCGVIGLLATATLQAEDGFPPLFNRVSQEESRVGCAHQDVAQCTGGHSPPCFVFDNANPIVRDEFRTTEAETIFRGQSPPIVPLINRQATSLIPVRRLSIPNPIKLLGDLARSNGRLRGAFGSNFDGREMIYGNLILNGGLPVGIDTEVTYRTDERRRLANRRFMMGDFNVVYSFRKIQWVAFRVGAGANWLHDGEETEWGFNSTMGFDFRIKDPWYISTVFDWGTLGKEELFHWQITGGIDLGKIEVFIGYDFHQIRSRERKTYIAGLGLWF